MSERIFARFGNVETVPSLQSILMNGFNPTGAIERQSDKERGSEQSFLIHGTEIAAIQTVDGVVPKK